MAVKTQKAKGNR